MATGPTITGALDDSLPTVKASARSKRQFKGVMSQLVDKVTLEEGTGLTWEEVLIDNLSAQAIQETSILENFQKFDDSLLQITPTMVGISTFITLRTARRISKKAYAKLGGRAGDAMTRKKDEDGLVIFDSATTTLGAAGSTMISGYISAAKFQITSNSTEMGVPPFNAVLHGYQIHPLESELKAGVGTDAIPSGPTADIYKRGFNLPICSVNVYEDGNMTVNSSDDASAGVFAKEGIVLVQGASPTTYTDFIAKRGGGGTALYMYDEYAYGIRLASWIIRVLADATAPTS